MHCMVVFSRSAGRKRGQGLLKQVVPAASAPSLTVLDPGPAETEECGHKVQLSIEYPLIYTLTRTHTHTHTHPWVLPNLFKTKPPDLAHTFFHSIHRNTHTQASTLDGYH